MILTQAGLVFMGLLVIITGVQGETTSMCASLGSTVNLPCSAGNLTSGITWFTIALSEYRYEKTEIQDGNRVSYNMSENNQPLLTIKDVRISDENNYCCSGNLCWRNRVHLRVTDLQVKVIPATDGETVTLMCSPGCPLAEPNATYIWYRNGAFLYEDWSPWYQQLVSNDSAVRYSCAVKGAEHLRAPEVSVDSVTSTCFSVSYAKGRMCFYTNSSEDEPCSITYPRDLQIKRAGRRTESEILTCDSSCTSESNVLYAWYTRGVLREGFRGRSFYDSPGSFSGYTCAVRGYEDLLSPEFCLVEKRCWSVTYVSRRICALEGSSVTIISQHLTYNYKGPGYLFWSRMNAGPVESAEKLTDGADRVEYQSNTKNQHMLRITDLKKNDSAEYRFNFKSDDGRLIGPKSPGVTVVVTDLNVKIAPSSDVTHGQTVTLTCSSSCPLTDDKNYVWFLNTRPLTLPDDQNKKHLVIDKVTTEHAGAYACAVTSQTDVRSPERTLTVSGWSVGTGVRAAFVVLMPLVVIFWIRRKKSSTQPPRAEASIRMDQLNPEPVDDVPDADPEQEDIL